MIIRQGDILLVKVGEAQASGKSQRVIIGHGEVTGHMHVLQAAETLNGDELAWQLFAETGEWRGDGSPQVAISQETQLVHDEHDTLTIPAGIYEIRRQREYEPEAPRYVID